MNSIYMFCYKTIVFVCLSLMFVNLFVYIGIYISKPFTSRFVNWISILHSDRCRFIESHEDS